MAENDVETVAAAGALAAAQGSYLVNKPLVQLVSLELQNQVVYAGKTLEERKRLVMLAAEHLNCSALQGKSPLAL